MTTFVLIHGGYHGGWCWQPLVEVLARRGHRAIAPDLPCDDPDAGYAEYVAAVLDAMGPADDPDVVVVGHSLGCYTAPLVALQRTVRRLVLLCAVPALPGEPIPMDETSILTPDLLGATTYVGPDGLQMMSPATFHHLFYEGLDPVTACAALLRLRPQAVKPMTELWPLTAWPAVPKTIVLATDDRVVAIERGIVAARRLLDGDEPVVLPGSHSVFYTDTEALADVLVQDHP